MNSSDRVSPTSFPSSAANYEHSNDAADTTAAVEVAKESERQNSFVSSINKSDDGAQLPNNDAPLHPRPSSPVAKTLEEQKQNNSSEGGEGEKALADEVTGNNSSKIPNLLNSGRFEVPHSPNRLNSISPPTFVSSPMAYNMASPTLPAAPPSTPYTPSMNYASLQGSRAPIANNHNNLNASDGSNIPTLHPPLPLAAKSTTLPTNYTLMNNNRSSSPPLAVMQSNNINQTTVGSPPNAMQKQPPNIQPISLGLLPPQLNPSETAHYNTLLQQVVHETTEKEKARIASLTEHESQNYTTIDEYKHALARERRYSTSLAIELSQYKFLTRYTSCNIHSAAEINEEARINHLIKNIDTMKKSMNDEKCRVVMELEREEERIINGLMNRLEEVKREKALLECQIGNHVGKVEGIAATGGMSADEQRLHAQFERMMADHDLEHPQQQHHQQVDANNEPERKEGNAAATQQKQQESAIIGSELSIDRANNKKGDSEEEEGDEEEEEYNDDILGDVKHDPEMEEELAKLLKAKEESK